MRAVQLFSVLVLLSVGGAVTCLRIRDFRIPSHVAEGSEAVLSCKYDLGKQQLYAVKWFKDDREFYRYQPAGNGSQAFTEKGVSVDLERSDRTTVTLVHLISDSEGEYRCEVICEAPGFKQISAKGHISVYLFPKLEPQVTGHRKHYRVNDPLEINCTSLGARPKADLKWLVNGKQAPVYHVRGPWDLRSVHPGDATDTTLELSFGVQSNHFQDDVMTITCQATIPPLYHKETVLRYHMFQNKVATQIETSTEHYIKTTAKPCTSTIKIQLEEPPKDMEPWSLTSKKTDSAGSVESSIIALLLCILFGAFFRIDGWMDFVLN